MSWKLVFNRFLTEKFAKLGSKLWFLFDFRLEKPENLWFSSFWWFSSEKLIKLVIKIKKKLWKMRILSKKFTEFPENLRFFFLVFWELFLDFLLFLLIFRQFFTKNPAFPSISPGISSNIVAIAASFSKKFSFDILPPKSTSKFFILVNWECATIIGCKFEQDWPLAMSKSWLGA